MQATPLHDNGEIELKRGSDLPESQMEHFGRRVLLHSPARAAFGNGVKELSGWIPIKRSEAPFLPWLSSPPPPLFHHRRVLPLTLIKSEETN